MSFTLSRDIKVTPGPAGAQGSTGPAGPRGPVGLNGPTGPRGNQGNVGPQGNNGAIGPTGPQGTPGTIGMTVTGPTGPPGIGATGPQGAPGTAGTIGMTVTGPTGPPGIGATGPQGIQGAAGTIGATGQQGIQGPTGPTGGGGGGGLASTGAVAAQQLAIWANSTGTAIRGSGTTLTDNGYGFTLNYTDAGYQMSKMVVERYGVSIGYASLDSASVSGVAIGEQALSKAFYSVAIGRLATSHLNAAVAIGPNAQAKGQNSVAIGNNTSANHSNSLAIGDGMSTSDSNGIFLKHNIGAYSGTPVRWYYNQLVEVASSMQYMTTIDTYLPDLTKFSQLRPVSYWSPKGGSGTGLVAEELNQIYPEFVQNEPATFNPRGVYYDQMIALLIAKIQQLEQQVIALTPVV